MTRVGTLKNVVVCLDLNGNDACDSGEPASAATGADGKYTISYDPTAVPDAASACLIALVKAGDPAAAATAIDSANPAAAATTADYVLTRPAGAGGAINPLTTLVQTGVAAGMTEADARANVAVQLAIDAAKIDNYQDEPVWDDANVRDNIRMAAGAVAAMLRDGVPLEVGDPDAAAPAATSLRAFNYTGAGDYYVRTLEQEARAAGSASVELVDARSSKSGGAALGDLDLYGTAFLTPDGWQYCTRDVVHTVTLGNPSRTVYCNGETSLGWSRPADVAGQPMASLVSRWQGLSSNTINTGGRPTAALTAALGSVVFPAGAQEALRTNIVVGQTVMIDSLGSRGTGHRSLDALIDAYPTSGAASPTGANTRTLGTTTSALKNLRVSFAPSSATQGTATYYECDLNEAQTVASNCAALAGTGTYSIDEVNGERLLRFAGKPPQPTMTAYDIVYTEINWGDGNQWTYRAHQTKPNLGARVSATNRLNGTAWAAMKTQLGL